MRISFDLDGVLYPWHQVVWDKFFRKIYPDYIEFWKEGWHHVSESQWNAILGDPVIYTLPARADVVQMVQRVAAQQFVFYVTQRPDKLAKVTQQWLAMNGFPYPGDCFLTQDKVKVCKKLEINLHVEDRIDVMNNLADNDISVLGVKQPWNEDHIDDFPHVTNMLDIEREIARIDSAQKVHRRRNGNG
jgi:uncharacterized HAD superfamily protein